MTEDEKSGFQNGCRVMLKMMEGGAYMLQDGGQRAIAALHVAIRKDPAMLGRYRKA